MDYYCGKTVVSTGAASGMGLLLCQTVAAAGGNVVMADINEEALIRETDAINAKNQGKAIYVVCDVRDYNQICAVRDKAVEEFGKVDMAVNFAGGSEMRILNASGEFPDVPIDVFDWGLDVNLKGQFYMCHAMMKQMREQKSGVLVNIGSITGEDGSSWDVAYSTAKSGAMNGLTKSVAMYGAPYGVRCVCVSPGPVMTRPGMANMKTAIGHAAQPQEIVDLVLFLGSDKGANIDGINILSDGGRHFMFNKG